MWRYEHPTEIIFGKSVLQNLGDYLEQNNIQKALLIATNSSVKNGTTADIVNKSAGRILDVVSGIEPNPTIENVEMCAKKARELEVDYIIALGGGSVIDCAKAVCAVVAENCTAIDLMEGKNITKALPLIAIPTVSGASSEVTGTSVISWKEKDLKRSFTSPLLFPKTAVIDPELTYSCPKHVTAISGIDIIAHSLDSLGSVKSNPLTEHFAVQAAKLAFENLEAAVNGNAEAKDQLAFAAVLAGFAFSQTGTTASHACSYILTAKYDIPHAEACAFTLDSWFKINAEYKPLLEIHAKNIGFSNVDELVNALNDLKIKLGLRTILGELEIPIEDLEIIVQHSLDAANMKNNIAPVDEKMIRNVFLSK
ncbi:iron-containing alcohol dehydrogenase [Lysinibacillus endophyticus]|uniref:iron-containing alcohol dehydrogenase n=1 Tax=Ureibacillus endophyticus TaxID=1978490 RepID=UPI00209F94D4|nr:iron-containing alcohol dehydrogenase [Lysinibacillus endophyticus]MCP1143345.1 iron-containing alcohol dehydrogenase [Lysinibacillus endophyticus]